MKFEKLNFETVPSLYEKRNDFFKDDTVDLSETKEIDSAGIAFLVQWAKALSNKKLTLLSVPKNAMDLIYTFKLNQLFEIK